ncbi:LOW QUALITY PROTEIN: hypothetical protein HZS_4171 [Henneguya salminicola]|nr:LOW QUALITY PROTEIN: hypothetical protein HZS_4171 [Henneguya salminicola]
MSVRVCCVQILFLNIVFNKDHFSLRLGVIDVVNFHDFNYRIEISPVDHDLDKNITYAVAAAGDFMVLDDLEFESIPNISVAFSHDSATSASSTFYDPRLDASHILDSDRKNLLICMVKTAKLLIIKEMLTSKLTCLNLLSEQEGLFKTTCCLSILVKYAQIVYSIDQTNTKLEALLGKIETLVKNFSIFYNLFQYYIMHSLKSSSLSNVSRSVMISLNKNLTNISTPLFGQIIYLLLSYINEFKTSKDQQKTANETITSELKSLLSLSQQEFLNEFQKNINDIIWF